LVRSIHLLLRHVLFSSISSIVTHDLNKMNRKLVRSIHLLLSRVLLSSISSIVTHVLNKMDRK